MGGTNATRKQDSVNRMQMDVHVWARDGIFARRKLREGERENPYR